MTELQEVDVTIHPDGRVELKVRGAAGPTCLTVTKDLERFLGGQVELRELTDEYRQPVKDRSTQPLETDD